MRLNKKKSTLLFFSSFILAIIISSISISTVGGVSVSDNTIRYDWLDVDVYNDPSDNVELYSGGIDLIRTGDAELFQTNDALNQVVFKKPATFGFEVVAYTTLDNYDIFPNMNINAKKTFIYLQTLYFNPWPFPNPGWVVASITTNSIDYGDIYNPNEAYVGIPISLSLAPDFADLSGQSINGFTIKSTEYLYQIKTIKVVDVVDGFCGDYEDQYTEQRPIDYNVNMDSFLDGANQEALGTLAGADLGVWVEDRYDTTIQQEKITTLPISYMDVNAQSGPYVFNDMVSMQPKVTKTQQRLKVTTGSWEYCHFYKTSTVHWIQTHKETRDSSMHVYNVFVHKQYEVNINILTTIQLDEELYESFLQDPFLRMGNWIWNEELSGTTDITLVQNESAFEQILGNIMRALFGPLGLIILIIVIVAICYFIGRRRRRRRY